MRIISSAFKNNEQIPQKYTCDGADVNPPLQFYEIPAGTVSLVLIVDDPDAPSGTWVHWVVYNIRPDILEIAENSTPSGSNEGITSLGKPGWGGPCPPSGVHRYFFKLYALDRSLDLPLVANKLEVEQTMQNHILQQASLIGLYQR